MDERLRKIAEEYISDFKQKRELNYVVKSSIPIIWFGDMEKYLASPKKVVTVGLNPSFNEFSEKRIHLRCEDLCAGKLYCALNNYFKINPYRSYFNHFNKILEVQNATYNVALGNKSTAIHIDVFSSIATDPTWGKLSKIQQNEINQFGLFQKLLDYLSPNVILISIAKQTILDIFHLETNDLIYKKHSSNGPELEIYKQNNRLIIYGRNRKGSPFSVENEIIDNTKEFLTNKYEQNDKFVIYEQSQIKNPFLVNGDIIDNVQNFLTKERKKEMKKNVYPFDGGEFLGKIGAVWFVSYCYFRNINSTHRNWQNISTANYRISIYNRTEQYHKFWLQKVLQMNDINLEKNTIGLQSEQVKKMAMELLGKLR